MTTLSTRNLVEKGRTMPQTRLRIINGKPNASSLRRGRISSLSSGNTLRKVSEVFFLDAAGDTNFRIKDVWAWKHQPNGQGSVRGAALWGRFGSRREMLLAVARFAQYQLGRNEHALDRKRLLRLHSYGK